MPRQPRSVFANIPHHITQRGNRRQDVFFSNTDKDYYLKLLQQYALEHQVEVLAYCLMTNHIHLILKPATQNGLQKVLKPVHMRYSQYINKQKDWSGILWQGRFFSSALDDKYTYHAFRYVENNPVRARMVEKAIDYPYSSAQNHAGLRVDNLIADYDIGVKVDDYINYLETTDDQNDVDILRRNIHKGLPCGSDHFISRLGKLIGRDLAFKNVGRPRKG